MANDQNAGEPGTEGVDETQTATAGASQGSGNGNTGDRETITVKTKLKDAEGNLTGVQPEATFTFDLPDSLEQAEQKYGEELVFDLFIRSLVIKVQAAARTLLSDGADEDAIQKEMADYRPDVSRRRTKDPLAAGKSLASKMTPEQKAELMAFIQGGGEL